MRVISPGDLYFELAVWIVIAIAGVVAATYFLRPRVRARYPGGSKRYVLALLLQSAAFMIPIPVVMVALIGSPVPAGLDVVLAITAGVLFVVALRFAPFTGPLLADLHRARIAEAQDRVGVRS